jgi:hypothetical protein
LVKEAAQLGGNGLLGIGFEGMPALFERLAIDMFHNNVGALAAFGIVLLVDGVNTRDWHAAVLADIQHVPPFGWAD